MNRLILMISVIMTSTIFFRVELAETQVFEMPAPIPLLDETHDNAPNIDFGAEVEEITTEEEKMADIPVYEDIWQLGEAYGISGLDVTRTLILVSYEGYPEDYALSYYCACCCINRAVNGYWGYGNLYRAFGEADESYDVWMDGLGYTDLAYEVVWDAIIDYTEVNYCNGMTVPYDYVYYSDIYGIYVW